MRTVSVQTLEEDPRAMLSLIEGSEEVEICRDGVPVARVVPVAPALPEPASLPYPLGKPRTPEEIAHYILHEPPPSGPYSEVTGAELVSWMRGDI